MKCEECISLLEDYRYLHFNADSDRQLVLHLDACAGCAGEYAVLRREQEIYTQCELQVAPQFWAGVQARITQEEEARFYGIAGLLNGLRLNPVLTVAMCLVVVGSLAGLMRYIQTRSGSQRASSAESQSAQQHSALTEPNSMGAHVAGGQEAEASFDGVEKNPGSSGALPVRVNRKRPGMPAAVRKYAGTTEKPPLDADPIATRGLVLPAQRRIASDLDRDSARHIERAEMMLLSFKNGSHLPGTGTLDLSHERRLAKDLVGNNILLRRDAELEGNAALARLLGRLEPFLLDIANLQDSSDRKEIRLVGESLMREQIIGALKVF